jgi:hypothetical protein
MVRTDGAVEQGFESSASCSDGTKTASEEPDKKKVRLDVKPKSQSDADCCVTSAGHATRASGALSVDSCNDATDKGFHNSSLHKKIDDPLNSSLETSETEMPHNAKVPRNTNIAVSGLPRASDKPLKFGTNCGSEKDRKSVYEIIVEHNIAVQVTKPNPKEKVMNRVGGNETKAAPMVYFPCPNAPRNSNTSEIAAKITERFWRQAYEDWIQCGIPDESGNM